MEHWSSHLLTVVIDRSSNLFVPTPTSVYAACRNVYFYWFFFSFFEDMSDEMKLLQGPESNPGGMLTLRVWADSYCCPFNPGFHSPLILWALSLWCLLVFASLLGCQNHLLARAGLFRFAVLPRQVLAHRLAGKLCLTGVAKVPCQVQRLTWAQAQWKKKQEWNKNTRKNKI